MKKKLLTLLTLLVCVCTGAWGAVTDLSFTATKRAASGGEIWWTTAANVATAQSQGWCSTNTNGNSKKYGNIEPSMSGDATGNASSYTISANAGVLVKGGNIPSDLTTSKKALVFKVTNVTEIKAYGATTGSKDADGAAFQWSVYKASDNSAVASSAKGKAAGPNKTATINITGLSASETYIVSIEGGYKGTDGNDPGSSNQDLVVYAIKLIAPDATAAPSSPTFSTNGGSVDGGSTTTITSTNADVIYYCWTATSSAPAQDAENTWTAGTEPNGQSCTVTVPNNASMHYLHAYGKNNYSTSTSATVTSNEFTISVLAASDLAIKSGKATQTLAVDGTLTFTKDVDYTTSSTGAISLTSSTPGVVSIEGATITATGAGKTTITLTQAADASYTAGSVEYTIYVIPKSVLDLSNATTANNMFKNGWLFDTPYFDTTNKIMVFSMYSAYQSQTYQTWVSNPKNGSGIGGTSDVTNTWSSSNVGDGKPFKGGATDASTYYIAEDKSNPHYATLQPRAGVHRNYYLRIKGVTKISTSTKGVGTSAKRVYMSAWEINDNVQSTDSTSVYTSSGNDEVLTLNLTSSKEYLINFYNTEKSNAPIYEVALYYDTDGIGIPENRIRTSAAGWASYTPMYDCSRTLYSYASSKGTEVNTVTKFVASVDEGVATISTVGNTEAGLKTGEGYFIKGNANSIYRTTKTAGTVTAPTGNLIKGQTTSGTVKSDGSATRYALLTYDADNYGLYKLNTTGVTIPAGKAYLEISTSGPGARALDFLSLDFDNNGTTGLAEVKSKTADVKGDFYDLSGRKVAQPTKGLYIVNGKKVVIK